ncbi:MAG: His/Gly/Thr/Pro-type tRNA ligase C-terminal domain-containing protein, partial [Clostridia bacterium]
RNFPGVGVSIGATRLFDLLRTNGLIDTFSSTLAKVAIIPIGEYSLSAIKIGAQLRQNGISTDVYYFEKNLKGKLNFANKSGVGHIILIGEEENRSGVYVLKNMQSGTQEKLSIDEIIEKLK